MKSASLAFLAAVGNTALVSTEVAEALNVMFVNEFPNTPIDLYWENHSLDNNHPERRKLEARIPPRGGWHSSETFSGHGKFIC